MQLHGVQSRRLVGMPNGVRITSLLYASFFQTMVALNVVIYRQKQQGSGQPSSVTQGDRGSLSYGEGKLQDLVWKWRLAIFAKAPTPGKLNSLMAGLRSRGDRGRRRQGGIFKAILVVIMPTALVVLLLTFLSLLIIKHRLTVALQPGVAPVSGLELRNQLPTLNNPERPFAVWDREESDLVVKRKIVDTAW